MEVSAETLLFSLYVGDLDQSVTEEDLVQKFSRFEGYLSAILCTNSFNQRSLCYGYVNFRDLYGATRAIEALNHTVMNGKAIRVMWSQPNSEARLSGIGNLFVKNLAASIDSKKLHQMFSEFGNILSCKVSVSEDGKSKGYGFVQYTMEESALNAIQNLNCCNVEGKELYVGHFIRRDEKFQQAHAFNNLYIKNLPQDVTEELLEEKFSKFGKITSTFISKDANGISKGFGFVNFENPDDAKRAKETMHGSTLGLKVLYVTRAQKKAERRAILRAQFDRMRKDCARLYKGRNLYVKNINDDVDDMKLKEYFSPCGCITSAKVIRNDKGISRGFGFVCFSRPEEANSAMNTLSGILFHGKPLYIAFAQTKQERNSYLQILHGKIAAEAGGFPSTNYFGTYPNLYQRSLQVYKVPELRLPGRNVNGFNGFAPPPLPMVPNAAARQCGGRMNGHVSFPLPFMQTNLQGYNYSTYKQRAGQALANGKGALANGNATAGACQLPHQAALITMLRAASPDQRKEILGQKLYPLVKKLTCELSPKITEMLLEMDNSELLVLLDAPESLAGKVEEAMKMLQLSETKVSRRSSDV